jgi:hypothetical protein
MKETKTYHAVHDQNGNIKSIFIATSSAGAREMMTPEPGCSVSPVNLQGLKIPAELKLVTDEDANQLRELMKHYRVDTSIVSTLIKKSAN